jgi:hypothetical protein
MPLVFTDTVTFPGAFPLAGFTESQLPPDAAAVKADVTPAMASVCEAGLPPPAESVKLKDAGVIVREVDAADTVKVTGIVLGPPVEPDAVIVTEPV